MPPSTLPFVIDFNEYASSFGATLRLNDTDFLSFKTSTGDTVALDRIKSVWWRRPQPLHCIDPCNEATRQFIDEEYLRFWQSSLAALQAMPNVRWYNPYKKNETADCKFRQLQVAKQRGFSVPKTVVTNIFDEAMEFIASNERVIFKSFAGNEGFWQPTREYKSDYKEILKETISFCPVIFQEYVDGDEDFRVVVVDKKITSVRFDVGNSRYKFDVRIDTKSKAELCILNEIEPEIYNFMEDFGIRYGAFDFRRARSGKLFFFEVNPAGQFLYLDQLAGSSIAKDLAVALSENVVETSNTDDDNSDGFTVVKRAAFAELVPERIKHYE